MLNNKIKLKHNNNIANIATVKKIRSHYYSKLKFLTELLTHHHLAGGGGGFGHRFDGLGRLDLSDNDDVHGYFFSAHFWFLFGFLRSKVKTASRQKKNKI